MMHKKFHKRFILIIGLYDINKLIPELKLLKSNHLSTTEYNLLHQQPYEKIFYHDKEWIEAKTYNELRKISPGKNIFYFTDKKPLEKTITDGYQQNMDKIIRTYPKFEVEKGSSLNYCDFNKDTVKVYMLNNSLKHYQIYYKKTDTAIIFSSEKLKCFGENWKLAEKEIEYEISSQKMVINEKLIKPTYI